MKEQLETLMYFKTGKLHPQGTNTTSHFLDSEAIKPILALLEEEIKGIKNPYRAEGFCVDWKNNLLASSMGDAFEKYRQTLLDNIRGKECTD